MKKIIKLTLTAVLAIVASVACTREPFNSQPEVKKDGYRVIKLLSETTKTTLDENNQPLWAEGDQIAVYDRKTNAVVDVADNGFGQVEFYVEKDFGTTFFAAYPSVYSWTDTPSRTFQSDTTFAATVNIYNGTDGSGIDGTFGKAHIAVGMTATNDITLQNAVAILKVTGLTGTGTLSLSKYKTALVDVYFDDDINGTLFARATEKTAKNTDDFYPAVTINIEDATAEEPYYIPVFPGTKTEELELTFTPYDSKPQVMYLKTGVTLERNQIYSVAWRGETIEATTYGDVNTKLADSEIYKGIADDVPVQVTVPMAAEGTITLPDQTEGKAISIVLTGEAQDGATITIQNEDDTKSPATLIVSAPDDAELVIVAPNTHVVLNGKEYEQITSTTSDNTLVISQGVKVEKLILVQGGLEVHGTLTDVTVTGKVGEVVVRDCEGLSTDVYKALKDFIATGYKAVQNGSNYDIVPAEGVAKIGNVAYASLEEAIAAVQNDQTITLLTNVTNAKGISVDKKITFTVDFDGHTYTVNKPGAGSTGTQTLAFQLYKNQTITFKNGTINAAVENKTAVESNNQKPIKRFIQNYANLTLTDMTLDGTYINGDNSVVESACGNVLINGTTNFIAKENVASISVDTWKNSYPEGTAVTINTTGNVGIINCFTEKENSQYTQSSLTIENGKNITIDDDSDGEVIIVVKGGEFTDETAIKYAAKDANINITLQGNRTASGIFIEKNQNQKININLGGYTLTFIDPAVGSTNTKNQAFHIEKGNAVSLKNGKISIAESNKSSFKFIIQNYSNLTVENVALDGTNLGISGGSTFSNNYGTVAIIGNTSIKAAADGVALDAYYWPKGGYSEGVNVTVNTTGTIEGKIAFDHDDTVTDELATEKSSLSIVAGKFTDMSSVNYVAEGGTYTLANDVTLASPLEIKSGKTFTIDLGGKTLTGRTNITHGNVTFKTGTIAGGDQQALNVYGSSAPSAEKYAVVKVASDAKVTAEVFGVCLFGPERLANIGYGAGIDIEGIVTTSKASSSSEGAVFVSGNLGNNQDSATQTAMEGKNFVIISGTVTSASDAALALNGSATATITGTLTGNTGIAAKRGNLVVTSSATITGTGPCKGDPAPNGSGTEMTGSAVSASSTYGQQLSINLQGGTYTSKAYTILNNAVDNACKTFNISGGKYETTMTDNGIAVYARLGSVSITGGEFINESNSEATLHVGCPTVGNLQPMLTISGESTVVKNNAEGPYTYKKDWKPLCVNMANELTYSAVTITGGKFQGQKPECDDFVVGEIGEFVDQSKYDITENGNVWTVSAKSQQN